MSAHPTDAAAPEGGLRALWASPTARVGLGLLGAVALLALAGPLLLAHGPRELVAAPLAAPSAGLPLGANAVGQDLAAQLAAGARTSLAVALLAGAGTVALGGTIGLAAGWFGGTVEAATMRVVDLALVVPRLPLLVLVGAYLGPSAPLIAATIALVFWPGTARIVRAQTRSLRTRAHVRASRGFGAGARHVMRRHLLPELALVLAAALVAAASRAVLLEAGLAFLGLGDPTGASWGRTLRDAIEFSGLFYTPAWQWWLLPPTLAISALLIGLTLTGVGLEGGSNPRTSRHRPGATP